MASPKVSVLLPTWNGARDLRRLLPALAAQQVQGGFEIRAIDSSSDDDTRDLLARAGAHVERIDRARFQHGATRNALARGAQGEVLVFLSQDALPRGDDFLATLASAFDAAEVGGAFARILPHDDDDPLTARTVLAAPEASEHAAPTCFNDVASAMRRDVHARIPFPEVAFGEDSAWAALALAAGLEIRFVPNAVVHHAHRYGPGQAYARYRVDAVFQREVHGRRVRPTLASVLRGVAYEIRADLRFVRATNAPLTSLVRSPMLRGAQVLGQWAGSRGALGPARDDALRVARKDGA
ncbi:MAG: glycosyltransferase [Planctomycetota bacterium]